MTILNMDEMVIKYGKSGKLEDSKSLLIYFYGVETLYIVVHSVTIDFDHCLNELSLESFGILLP